MYDKVMSSISHIFIHYISYHLLAGSISFTYLALIRGVFFGLFTKLIAKRLILCR
jgi:hypothetical protein